MGWPYPRTHLPMILCHQCRYWRGNRFNVTIPEAAPLRPPQDEWRDGECPLLGSTLDIHASGGWDGATVDYIRTPASFGCVMGEGIDES
jgi:hypothetical protein